MTQRAVNPAVIRTRKLSKTFSHNGVQQHVLRNLDLEIAAGSFTVVMGPSGAGKSTLLYALSGLDKPTLGSVEISGVDITQLSEDKRARFRRQHCAFVFQQVHLLDALSVRDNLLAAGLLQERSRRVVAARAQELAERIGLQARDLQKFPAMLSGGEAQRVAIARALMNKPAVLFADEPTGQLNSEYSDAVLDLLRQLHADGQTIVMVTHDVCSAICGNRICYLRDGKVAGELTLTGDEAARTGQLTAFLSEMGW